MYCNRATRTKKLEERLNNLENLLKIPPDILEKMLNLNTGKAEAEGQGIGDTLKGPQEPQIVRGINASEQIINFSEQYDGQLLTYCRWPCFRRCGQGNRSTLSVSWGY